MKDFVRIRKGEARKRYNAGGDTTDAPLQSKNRQYVWSWLCIL